MKVFGKKKGNKDEVKRGSSERDFAGGKVNYHFLSSELNSREG